MSKTFLMAPGQRVCSDLENKMDKDGCAEICLLGADWEEVIIKHGKSPRSPLRGERNLGWKEDSNSPSLQGPKQPY